MLNEEAVRNWDFGTIVHAYTQRDTMLYALGIGMGADPMDEGELKFVFEIYEDVGAAVKSFAWRPR